MSNLQNTNSFISKSNPFDAITRSHLAAGLSQGARNLLAQMVIWAGKKGYLWWSVPKIAKAFDVSESSIRRWMRELVSAGFVAIVPRPGRSNYLIPYPDEFTGDLRVLSPGANKEQAPLSDLTTPYKESEKKTENQERCTVESRAVTRSSDIPSVDNDNASNEVLSDQSAQKAPSQKTSDVNSSINDRPEFIVQEIEQVTHDHHSRGCFFKIANTVSEEHIFRALSITRLAMTENSIHKPGAYFLRVIKELSSQSSPFGTSTSFFTPRTSCTLEESLQELQSQYPHLRVPELFARYCQVKYGGGIVLTPTHLQSYRTFLTENSRTLYEEKPLFRRTPEEIIQ